MDQHRFIVRVQDRAGFTSAGDAERATQAVLETLAERMTGGAARNLAAQLPEEIGDHLRRAAPSTGQSGERFSADEFLDRIGEREGVDREAAARHARAVAVVLEEATTGELMEKVRDQLPPELDEVLGGGRRA